MENNIDNNTVPDIWGYGIVKSDLSLEEVAAIISEKLFGGLPFGGKDRHIYEEVPAVLIGTPIMGMRIVLAAGTPGHYVLEIQPHGLFRRHLTKNEVPGIRIRFDAYLYHLLKQGLKDIPGIQVPEPESE